MGIAEDRIENEILRQIEGAVSVAPRDVAQALAAEGEDWRKLLPRVRAAAVRLHGSNRLIFLRKRKAVGPEGLKGVYRLARPQAD